MKPLRDRGAHREQGGTGTAAVWNEAGAAAGPNAVVGRGLGSLAVIPRTWGPGVAEGTGTCFSPCEFRGPGATQVAGATPGQNKEQRQGPLGGSVV